MHRFVVRSDVGGGDVVLGAKAERPADVFAAQRHARAARQPGRRQWPSSLPPPTSPGMVISTSVVAKEDLFVLQETGQLVTIAWLFEHGYNKADCESFADAAATARETATTTSSAQVQLNPKKRRFRSRRPPWPSGSNPSPRPSRRSSRRPYDWQIPDRHGVCCSNQLTERARRRTPRTAAGHL